MNYHVLRNCDLLLQLLFSWKVFKHYFEELEEESLRDNFVVVVSLYLGLDDVVIFIEAINNN